MAGGGGEWLYSYDLGFNLFSSLFYASDNVIGFELYSLVVMMRILMSVCVYASVYVRTPVCTDAYRI